MADARALLASLIDLNRAIRDSPHSRSRAPFPEPEPLIATQQHWMKAWRGIWDRHPPSDFAATG